MNAWIFITSSVKVNARLKGSKIKANTNKDKSTKQFFFHRSLLL